jgi:alcohol dehydrogenase (NADP+)
MQKTFTLPTGDQIPAIGLGTWLASPGEVGQAVREAIRAGYRHIDCAALYENEPEVGQAIADAIAAGDVRREELWVTSKLWNSSHLAEDVLPALLQTLNDLQLDYLDLYLIHWPIAWQPGLKYPERPDQYLAPEEAPLTDTWEVLQAVAEDGLCRNIGVSNFSLGKIDQLIEAGYSTPAMNQVELHPLLAQNALLEGCRERGIVLTAYAPLGSAGGTSARAQLDAPAPLRDPVVHSIAARLGATPAQVLLAWGMQRGTCVIPKSVHPDRLRENLAATELELDRYDMEALATLDRGERIFKGDFFCPPGGPYTVEWLWS